MNTHTNTWLICNPDYYIRETTRSILIVFISIYSVSPKIFCPNCPSKEPDAKQTQLDDRPMGFCFTLMMIEENTVYRTDPHIYRYTRS